MRVMLSAVRIGAGWEGMASSRARGGLPPSWRDRRNAHKRQTRSAGGAGEPKADDRNPMAGLSYSRRISGPLRCRSRALPREAGWLIFRFN
jgi:hypothetical protein